MDDLLYVRASVHSKCNLNCAYCAKEDGMENKVPPRLRGQRLSVDAYCRNLDRLARNGIRAISFTGGEPSLNPDLPRLVRFARNHFDRVELTSNGYRLLEMMDDLCPSLTLLKISLDAVSPDLAAKISGTRASPLRAALSAVESAARAGLPVAINVVAIRSNLDEIPKLVDICREINREQGREICHLSVLDFYYSAERRDFWEHEFVHADELMARLTALYGNPHRQHRFGCGFSMFEADGVHIRLKDSVRVTRRAKMCGTCPNYCQEGVYALKHSVEGWITCCPVNDGFGVHLSPELSERDADERISILVDTIRGSKPDYNSFERMLSENKLQPPG